MKSVAFRRAIVWLVALGGVCATVQSTAQSCKCRKNPGPGGGVQCAKDQIATCDASSGECNCTCDSVPRGKSKLEYESEILSKVLGTKVEPAELFSQPYKGFVSSFAADSDEKGTFHFDRDLGNGRKAKVTVGVPDWVDEALRKGTSMGPGASYQNCPNGKCKGIDARGSVEGGITAQPCSNVLVGGSGNQATINCAPPPTPDRTLSENNVSDLRTELSVFGIKPIVRIEAVGSDTDLPAFPNQLAAAFSRAGWEVRQGFTGNYQVTIGTKEGGISSHGEGIHCGTLHQAQPEVQKALDALKKIGLNCPVDGLAYPANGEALVVLIGPKPHPN